MGPPSLQKIASRQRESKFIFRPGPTRGDGCRPRICRRDEMAREMERSDKASAQPAGSTAPVGSTFRSSVPESAASLTRSSVPGLEYERFFAKDGIDPFDEVEWDL